MAMVAMVAMVTTSTRLFLSVCLGGLLLQAQPGTLPDPVRAAATARITAEGLKRDLEFLSSDELRGRSTPSPGFDRAAEFIAGRLKKAGFEPAGDEGTFFQRYTMRESTVDTDAASIEIDGRRFTFGDDFVMRAFPGPVSGKLPVVYVGHGWTVADKKIDAFAGVDVKGKVVLAHGPRALPKGVEIPMIGRVNVGATPIFAEAARRGAVAVIFIAQASAMQNWAQSRSQSLTQRELVPNVPSAYAAIPITTVMVTPQVAETLFANERIDGATLVARGEAQDYPESFQLTKSITLTLPAKTTTDQRPYNVVGILRGADPKLRDEYLVIEVAPRRRGRRPRASTATTSTTRRTTTRRAAPAISRWPKRWRRAAAEAFGDLSLGQRRGARTLGHALVRLAPAGAARPDRRPVQRRHDRREPRARLAGCRSPRASPDRTRCSWSVPACSAAAPTSS